MSTTPRPGMPLRRSIGFARRTDDRMVAGVAAGVAGRLGVDAAYVRAAFAIATIASGIGAVLYGLAWLASFDDVDDGPGERVAVASGSAAYRNAGFSLATLGVLLLLGEFGLWPSTTLMWTVILIAFGSATIWAQADERRRARLAGMFLPTEEGRRSRRSIAMRILVGGALITGGLVIFFGSNATLRSIGWIVLAATISAAGLMLATGPWIFRMWQQLGDERRERIRSEERTEMAAHLHDSVLQTLALIQGSNDPEEQAVLARIQERELRTWLFEGDHANGADRLARALEEVAAEVERMHQIAVEVVTVGDADMDTDLGAIVGASREALVNVARHAGVRKASVYAEISPTLAEVFVTDQGSGFDQSAVDPDRRGLAESIMGRMQRHGGSATIESVPGEGTEVHLSLPRSPVPRNTA